MGPPAGYLAPGDGDGSETGQKQKYILTFSHSNSLDQDLRPQGYKTIFIRLLKN